MKTFAFAAAIGLILGLSGQSASAETLRVGSTPTSVPFSFLDTSTNEVKGVMPDLMAAIAKEEGFTTETTTMPFGSLIAALQAGKIDIISAAMFATPKRAEVVDFSAPVYSYGEALIVPSSDTTDYKGFDDLKGKTVGAGIGTLYLAALQKSGVFGEVKSYDSVSEIIADVNAGRIAAGFGDYPIVSYQLKSGKFPKVRLVKSYQPSVVGSISIAVAKGHPETLAKINDALAKMKADGRLDAILTKWGIK